MRRQVGSDGASCPFPGGRRLARCDQVSVCELGGVERFVVWAIRWQSSADRDETFARSCLEDSFDRAGLGAARPAFERFVDLACGAPVERPAVERLGCWRLSPIEAHALHAIACLQSGLIGEAWKALAKVCVRREVGRALVHLGALADALEAIGGRVQRWQWDDRAAAPAR